MNKVQKGASSDATLHRRTAETAKGDHAFFAFLDGEGFVSSTSSCQQNRNVTFETKSASSHQNWQLAKKTTECYSISTSFITIHFGFITLTFSFCGVWETCPRLPRHPRHHQLLRRLQGTLSWQPQIKGTEFRKFLGKVLEKFDFHENLHDVTWEFEWQWGTGQNDVFNFFFKRESCYCPLQLFFVCWRQALHSDPTCLFVCVVWFDEGCNCVTMTLYDTTWLYFESNVYV